MNYMQVIDKQLDKSWSRLRIRRLPNKPFHRPIFSFLFLGFNYHTSLNRDYQINPKLIFLFYFENKLPVLHNKSISTHEI